MAAIGVIDFYALEKARSISGPIFSEPPLPGETTVPFTDLYVRPEVAQIVARYGRDPIGYGLPEPITRIFAVSPRPKSLDVTEGHSQAVRR